jgi:hypothetical protein
MGRRGDGRREEGRRGKKRDRRDKDLVRTQSRSSVMWYSMQREREGRGRIADSSFADVCCMSVLQSVEDGRRK